MAYPPTTDPRFLRTLESCFQDRTEILALIRFSHMGGAKSFEFFTSYNQLQDRLQELPPLTCVIAFREPQLQVRGMVTPDFIDQCLDVIPEDTEMLLVEMLPRTYGRISRYRHRLFATHEELRRDLEEAESLPVAIGPYPPWLMDNENVITAVVPNENGRTQGGAY